MIFKTVSSVAFLVVSFIHVGTSLIPAKRPPIVPSVSVTTHTSTDNYNFYFQQEKREHQQEWNQHNDVTKNRRYALQKMMGITISAPILSTTLLFGTCQSAQVASAAATPAVANTKESFSDLLSQLQQARTQLDKVPKLIETEKWDSVRAILIEKPLADCWAKTNRPLLTWYAESLGDNGGDELAALEAKEDLISHLRYLDMAVYNNVFNPITVEGKSGATKELIRSYYEDPTNEYKASVAALEEMIALSKDL